ncbi:MAG: glycosyltransferase family 39 protein [Cyanobacteria bacterium]|nr:glycosyltransferase family 39 protein [Cyanobacteriota bacterium]
MSSPSTHPVKTSQPQDSCMPWLCNPVLRYGLLLGFVAMVYALFFHQLGSYPFFDVDEPRYAEAAREMLESGNWVTPYFNYVVRFDKPIFFYWLIAGVYKIFGVSEYAARSVSALSATLIVFSMLGFGIIVKQARTGLLAAIMTASCLQVIGLSRMSITDMNLCLWMTLTSLSLLLVVLKGNRWWIAAGFFAGIGVLTKGPVALVLPGGILLVYSALTQQLSQHFKTRFFPIALMMMLVISLPWYILAYQANGPDFLDALFLHNVTRFESTVSGHAQPIWFFAVVLILGFLPWTPFLLQASVRYLWPFRKTSGINSVTAFYSGLWAVLVFLFFTVANTKLLTYILPMFPAVALFLATQWPEDTPAKNAKHPKVSTPLHWSGLVLFILMSILALVFFTSPQLFMPKEARHLTHLTLNSTANSIAIGILTLGCLVSWLCQLKKQWTASAFVLMLTMSGLTVSALAGVIPQVNQITQGPMLDFVGIIGSSPVATYEIVRPSLTYYLRRRVPHVEKTDRATLLEIWQDAQKTNDSAIKSLGQFLQPGLFLITKTRFIATLETIVPKGTVLVPIKQAPEGPKPIYALLLLTPKKGR